MAAKIPAKFRDLFEKRAFAHLATVMPDGSPQVTPVWVELDGAEELAPISSLEPSALDGAGANAGLKEQVKAAVNQLERELILRSLEKTGGNKRRAARLLNLSRTTLIDKLQRLEGGKSTPDSSLD